MFISETNKHQQQNSSVSPTASLIAERGQLVPRYDQALHTGLRDHHQVHHPPADVVSAHGQGQRCQAGERREVEDKEEVQTEIERERAGR